MNKIGRNAPCPCGSGKKYKFCCLNREEDNKSAQQKKDGSIYDILTREEMKILEMNRKQKGYIGYTDIINVYALPLLKGTRTQEETKKSLTIAMICWNMALVRKKPAIVNKVLAEMKKNMKGSEEFEEFKENVIMPMIERGKIFQKTFKLVIK